MDLDSIIGIGAAPLLIPLLVGATKPFVRMLFPKVCDDSIENGPWQFLAAFYGAVWMFGLLRSGHAPTELDNEWTAVLVGIALGLGSTLVRTGAVKAAEKVAPEKVEEPPVTGANPGARWAHAEPNMPPYEAPRRSS